MTKPFFTLAILASLASSEIIEVSKTTIMPKLPEKPFVRDDVEQVVHDSNNHLMWQDDSSSASVTKNWNGAKQYCENLNFAGYSDWRLPSIAELENIVDVARDNPAINAGFKNTAHESYWSSSDAVNLTYNAWNIHFNDGSMNYHTNDSSNFVRCVRDSQ